MTVILLLGAYLLGSIPIGFIIGNLKNIDIRQHGSGNIGTTNAFRILGPTAGCIVLIGDVSKGIVPVILSQYLTGNPNMGLLSGLCAIAGHNYSLFLRFKGGKGVATGAGVIFALSPIVFWGTVMIWGIVVLVSRYVSLGSIIAAAFLPVMMIYFKESASFIIFTFIISIFVIYRHRGNIQRLLQGNERKIGKNN